MIENASCDEVFRPLAQSDAYAAAAVTCGARVIVSNLGVGRALVVQRGRMRLITRGPMWEPGVPEAARRMALRRFARWPGVTLATTEEGLAGFGLIPLVTPLHHAVWDLSGDLRTGLHGKWRNRLAATERKGFGFERDRQGALATLVAAEARQRGARGYRTLPAAFTTALPETSLRLWEWRWEGAVAAGMCFVRHGATASYHIAWAAPAARDRSVHGLMLWQAALALRNEGVRWLDLGSVNTEDAAGLARFKLGTGAELRRLGSTCLVLPG